MKPLSFCFHATVMSLLCCTPANAQDASENAGARAAQAVIDGDAATFASIVGSTIELADPSLTRPIGVLSAQQVVDKLQGCTANIREGGAGPGSFYAVFDCPSTGAVPSRPACATEDWVLDVTTYRKNGPITILHSKRSNEGECYRRMPAPPTAPKRSAF